MAAPTWVTTVVSLSIKRSIRVRLWSREIEAVREGDGYMELSILLQ